MSVNPYESPASTLSDAPSGPFRVYNWNQAGGPLVIGLVGGPLLVALVLWIGLRNEGARASDLAALWAVVPLSLVGIVYALFSPTLWMEFGEVFRYRKLLWTRVCEWQDILSVEIMEETSSVRVLPVPGARITIGWHVALIVKLDERNDLIVHVSERQLAQVRQLLARLEHERKLKLWVDSPA
jgi:hypothetical protein